MSDNLVSSGAVLEKIQARQPAEFDNYTIVGDLNLSRLKIEKPIHFNNTIFHDSVTFNSTTFEVDAYFIKSTFNGNTYFRNSTFTHTADFWGSTFSSNADFGYSTFSGNAYFGDSTFNHTAYFAYSTFNDTAYFWGSTFSGNAYFGRSTFNHTADFGSSTFNHTADFWGSTFSGNADFGHSTFNHTAYFERSTFNHTAYFGFSTFSGNADLWGLTFNHTADFERSTFNGVADFGGSTFNDYADFRGSTFSGVADFEGSTFSGDSYFGFSTFSGDAYFRDSTFNGDVYFGFSTFNRNTSFIDSQFSGDTSFNNASIDKNVLYVGEESVFSGTLDLNRSNIENIETYIRWNNIGHLAFNIRIYNIFFDNYKKWRLFEDYSNCYYTFRTELLSREPMGLKKILDYFQWILNGFGMKPIFPIIWSIGIILIAGAIFYITNGIQRSNEKNTPNIVYIPGYQIPRKPLKDRISHIISQKRTISFGESMLFSATYFSSGANSIISTTPIDLSPIGISRYIAVLERLLGWFFFALFLAALGNTAIR